MADFTPELDRYEREARRRLDPLAAHHARTELAAHLAADYEVRIELGATPDAARAQALAALGDVRTVARAERRDPRRVALLLAAPVAMLGWIAGTAVAPWLDGLAIAIQFATLLGPSCALGLYAGLAPARPWSRFRPFLLGWAVAFGLSIVPVGIAMARQGPLRDLPEGVLLWAAGLSVPGLVGIVLGLALGTLVRMPGEGTTTRMLGAMRLFAPITWLLLALAAFYTKEIGLGTLALWVSPLLVVLGMADRRRLDLRSLLVGEALTIILSIIWSAVRTKFSPPEMALQIREIPVASVRFAVALLVLQIFALGFWTLVRRVAPARRVA